jgi:septum formation protein
MLASAGLDVQAKAGVVDEEGIRRIFRADGRTAAECALALAEAKALQIAGEHRYPLIVGADQILVCGKIWLDKPVDLDDARAQLQCLRGRTHELCTAACVVRDRARIWHTLSSARLTMRNFSDAFLEAYLGAEQSELFGSVGAYRIEGRGIQLFSDIEGDYFSILGLPLLELLCFLRTRDALSS